MPHNIHRIYSFVLKHGYNDIDCVRVKLNGVDSYRVKLYPPGTASVWYTLYLREAEVSLWNMK